jgi:hypothetical protein
MALALPLPTRSAPTPTRTRLRLVAMPAGLPLSALDLTMRRLAADHARHATGPVFPCPRCFTPPMGL